MITLTPHDVTYPQMVLWLNRSKLVVKCFRKKAPSVDNTGVSKEHPAFNSFDAKSAWGRSALDLADSNMKDDLTAAHQRPGTVGSKATGFLFMAAPASRYFTFILFK